MSSNLSPLNYTGYNMADNLVSLQNRLKLYASWKDIGASGTGEALLELFVAVLDTGMFYTERRAIESYLPLAKEISSVKNIVSVLNYQPKRKTSAKGTLTFSVASPATKNIYIPKHTSCSSTSGIKFITIEDAVIGKGQSSVTVNAIQGEIAELEVSANSSENQEYLINNTNVENSADVDNPTLTVSIDNVIWTKVDSFIDSVSDSTHYKVINEIDGTVSTAFGDDVNGKIPLTGSTILITYVKSLGLDGNVPNTGLITILNSVIYDEDGNVATVTVTNNASFLGGDNEEDIEEIRYEAPRVFKTGDRGVTRTDDMSILENFPGIANANVWGEKEEAELLSVDSILALRGIVRMSIILQDWLLPDATFKAALSEYLYDEKAMMTDRYEFITPTILNVIPVIELKASIGSSLSNVQTDAESAIADQFILGDTTNLGEIIKYSNIIAAINDLTEVAYVNMVLEIKKDLIAGYDSNFDFGITLDCLSIKPGTTRLFIDDVYVITDTDNHNGTGSFSMVAPYTISGTINYSTGEILLDVSPSPAVNIYARYQQLADGNIVPTFNQIGKLYDVDVTSISIV